jgi:predicted transcriptional regulator
MENSVSKEIATVLAGYRERHDLHDLVKRMNIPYPSLARILNENDPYDLGVRKVITFIQAANNDFALLDHIEVRLGRVAVPVKAKDNLCNVHGVCKLIKDSSEALEELSKALSDGLISSREASACIKELGDLMNTAMGLIQDLKKLSNRTDDPIF